jgi:hypothetical protein
MTRAVTCRVGRGVVFVATGVVVAALAAGAAPATRPAMTRPAQARPADVPPAQALPAQAAPRRAPPQPFVEIDRAPLPPVGVVRKLEGDDYSQAVDARGRADLARGAFERRHRSFPAAPTPEADAEFGEVVAAYLDVITRFPGSELDCYCRICLSGAYTYRGRYAEALDEAKKAAEVFAGSPTPT